MFQAQQQFQSRHGFQGNSAIRRIASPREGSDLVAVIVSFRYGSSYDEVFTTIAQKSAPGTHVSTYLVENIDPIQFLNFLKLRGDDTSRTQEQWGEHARELMNDIGKLNPENVVFNWECCSGCSNENFPIKNPVPLMAYLLENSFMVLCSDFSLKALIHNWDEAALGVNPFEKVGEFHSSVTLRFDPEVLRQCEDSAQLQILGELCSTGVAQVRAMSGTIVFAVNGDVSPSSHSTSCVNGWRDIQMLTIATDFDGQSPFNFTQTVSKHSKIGEHRGLAGHCLLRYPSGGRLLVGCPHWIELSKLDVTAERLMQVAGERYGADYRSEMRARLAQLPTPQAQQQFVQSSAQMFVQQTSPSCISRYPGAAPHINVGASMPAPEPAPVPAPFSL